MMRSCSKFNKLIACIVAFSFFLLSGIVAPSQAALIGTGEILTKQANHLERERIAQFLSRDDVAQHLQAWGVDKQEAQRRVDAMTDEEVQMVAAKINELPTGGDAIGFVAAVAFIAFVTLIITDIIGLTDVFTFIKKR